MFVLVGLAATLLALRNREPAVAKNGSVSPAFFDDFNDRDSTDYPGRGFEDGVFHVIPATGGTIWSRRAIDDGIVGTSFRLCENTYGAAIVAISNKQRKDSLAIRFFDDGTREIEGTMLAGDRANEEVPRIGPMRVESLRPVGQYNQLQIVSKKDRLWVYVNSQMAAGPVEAVGNICPASLLFGAAHARGKTTRVEFDYLAVWATTDIKSIAMPPGVELPSK
jgi:hypothetical protein